MFRLGPGTKGAGRPSVLLVLGLLAAAAVYELLVATEVLELGKLPGQGAPGGAVVGIAAGVAISAGVGLAGILSGQGGAATRLSALLAPAAALFMVARYYSFDPYYLPTLTRYADVSIVAPLAVFVVAALACLAGFLTWFRRVPGLLLSAPVILACGLAAWFMGVGH